VTYIETGVIASGSFNFTISEDGMPSDADQGSRDAKSTFIILLNALRAGVLAEVANSIFLYIIRTSTRMENQSFTKINKNQSLFLSSRLLIRRQILGNGYTSFW